MQRSSMLVSSMRMIYTRNTTSANPSAPQQHHYLNNLVLARTAPIFPPGRRVENPHSEQATCKSPLWMVH
jgi:hypothetical protein